MRRIQLPKFDVNYIEILITEEISVSIDIGLCLNIVETFKDVGAFKLTIRHFKITFPICHKEHSIYYAY